MKNHRRKRRRKKDKTSQGRVKKLSSTEEDEINPRKATEDKELYIQDGAQLTLVDADPYSLYERTSLRQHNEAKKGDESCENILEKYEEGRKRVLKGHHKSSLPPLREKNHNRKQLTFAGEKRAITHSMFETKPGDIRTNNVAPTFENQKKLALSLSFAGIYDLEEMYLERKSTETKRDKTETLEGILKSSKNGIDTVETLDKTEDTSVGVKKCEGEIKSSEKKKCYVIKTLTLEDESPVSQRKLFPDKLILPRIKKNAQLSRSTKLTDDEYKITKAREENRLPRIGESENMIPTFADSNLKRSRSHHRRKERVHDNSFEQVYLERNIPRLPVLVNGRITLS